MRYPLFRTHRFRGFNRPMTSLRRLNPLVVVAAPRFLGELRKAMTPAVKQALHSEIDGDYTTHTPQQIGKVLSKKLA